VQHAGDHRLDLGASQATKRQLRQVGPTPSGGLELRASGEQEQEAGGGHLVEEEHEELECRGIDPVQVFANAQHRVLFCLLHQPGEQGFQVFLALPLGHEGYGSIPRWQR
jgi:hypothetical protein